VASLRRGRVDDQRAQELRKLGVPADQAQQWLAAQEPDEGEADDDGPLIVWPENRPVVRLFMQLEGQWHRRPLSGALDGLRYEAARTAIELQRLKKPRRLWRQLVEMEQAALEAWHG
jgi:hypothetical protein